MIIIKGICLEKPQGKMCLLTPEFEPFRSYFKGKYSAGKEFLSLGVQGKKLLTLPPLPHFITSLHYSEMATEKSLNLLKQRVDLPHEKEEVEPIHPVPMSSIKVIPKEKTEAGYISTINQRFKRDSKGRTNPHNLV